MRVGLKLDMGFSQNELYRRLLGDRDILAFVKQLGFEAIETAVGPETQGEPLLEHARLCIAAGFRLSLHPYSEQTAANPAFFRPEAANPCRRLHERVLEWAGEIGAIQQSTTVVNIHAAAHSDVARAEQIQRSVQFFRWCRQWCEAHAGAVRVVAELQIAPNPDERVQRIGDRYEELLEVVEASGISACWDFGHAVMNHRRLDHPLEPPAEFLERVGHIHCHDVNNSDHQPLLFHAVPWERFLRQVTDRGFGETLILEVPPEHFLANGGLDSLVQSAAELRKARRKVEVRSWELSSRPLLFP